MKEIILNTTISKDRTTFTWDIDQLDIRANDVVYNVHWRLIGKRAKADSNEIITKESHGVITLQYNPNNFISYNQLTKAKVVNWVNVKLGLEIIREIQKQIELSIDLEKSPANAAPLPW